VDITWYGRTCFRIKGRAASVITDPVSKRSGYSMGTAPAEVVSVSRRDLPDLSDDGAVKGDHMVFDAPGVYERGGILVKAVAQRRKDGKRNAMFSYEVDGLRVVHLGLPDTPPTRATLDELGEIDVLLVPIGNPDALSAKAAADLINLLDPPVVIPMDFAPDGGQGLVDADAFLKELGVSPQPQPLVRLTRGTIPSELTVMLLEPRAT
jgi:L-ascorbate metabolism protein UlaG (beta-lactamase superfamily)